MVKNIKKGKIIFLWVIIVFSLGSLIFYAFVSNSLNIKEKPRETVYFSHLEKTFINEKDKITLGVSENLAYMQENDFLVTYMEEVVPSLKFKISNNSKEARGDILVINQNNRDEMSKKLLSKPLFTIQGNLFKREEVNEKEEYTAVGIDGTLTAREIKKLKYNGHKIKYTEKNKNDIKNFLVEERPDFVIGDINVMPQIVGEDYIDSGNEVFKRNVCVVLNEDEKTLYNILTLNLESLDKKTAIVNTREKTKSSIMINSGEKKYSESIVLVVIVFLTVFGAFLIYYLSTKNLYKELTTRMDQLTESKSEMKTTFDGVPFYMAELDINSNILNLNKAMIEELKMPVGEIKGKSIVDVFTMTEETKEMILGAIVGTKKMRKGQNNIANFNNKIFDVDIYPIETQKINIEKLLFMAADVTNVKMAERQMLQQNKMIAVGQLAAGVAHEIRNPLGIIRNYSYVLKTTEIKDEEQQKKAILGIENAVEKSEKIIRNLLNFSRVSNEEAEKINIKEHIDSVILINEGMLKKKQIKINVKSDEKLFIDIRIGSFDMIFINLFSNGVEAIKDNGEININLWKEKKYFFMEFKDTGCGMNQEVLDNMFNPFFTTKGKTEGNGLGMYIVYNEVDKLNGKIEVTSEVNKGTTFKIKIPLIGKEEH